MSEDGFFVQCEKSGLVLNNTSVWVTPERGYRFATRLEAQSRIEWMSRFSEFTDTAMRVIPCSARDSDPLKEMDKLTTSLINQLCAITRINEELNRNLTNTQTRCNELLEENRRLKKEANEEKRDCTVASESCGIDYPRSDRFSWRF